MLSLCKSFNYLVKATRGIDCLDSSLNATTSRLVYILSILIFNILSESCLNEECKSDACSLIDITTVSIIVAEDMATVHSELRWLVSRLLLMIGLD